jgi:hypothetical protein
LYLPCLPLIALSHVVAAASIVLTTPTLTLSACSFETSGGRASLVTAFFADFDTVSSRLFGGLVVERVWSRVFSQSKSLSAWGFSRACLVTAFSQPGF